jgi:hypothetical protein
LHAQTGWRGLELILNNKGRNMNNRTRGYLEGYMHKEAGDQDTWAEGTRYEKGEAALKNSQIRGAGPPNAETDEAFPSGTLLQGSAQRFLDELTGNVKVKPALPPQKPVPAVTK